MDLGCCLDLPGLWVELVSGDCQFAVIETIPAACLAWHSVSQR